VFSADRLYGPWIPHPMNPVKIDARSACSAGTPFKHDGVLYRPAQDCSEQYGKRVVINKVTCLTETRFSEEPVAFIEAFSGRYHAGTHTVSSVGDQTLVDGQRFTMHFDGLRRLAKKYARSALSAIGMSDEGIVRLKRRLRR